MKMTQLSVSSAILAAVLSGCSQQQVIGGSQVAGGSQQQIESAAPVVVPQVLQPRVVANMPKVVHEKKRVVRRVKPKPAYVMKRRSIGLPTAKPGQCFAKVKVPATYKTQSRKILIKKASSKRVLVRAPQYRWVNKKVLVRKAMYKSRVQPAVYKTTYKRVMVKPAYNTWRKGHGAITRIDNMTGEIMCRVKVPAVYKNISRRVLVRPARTIRTLVPAVYKTVKQKQRISAALYKTVNTPARYRTQNYRIKVGGARYVWRSVLCKTNAPKGYRSSPKQYRKAAVKRKPVVRTAYKNKYRAQGISYENYLKVMNAKTSTKVKSSKKLKTKKAAIKKKVVTKKTIQKMQAQDAVKKVVKKPAVTNAPKKQKQSKAETKKGIVFNIQNALKNKGFDPGAIDGKMGPGTAAALKAFQKSHGLPVGQLTKDTFRALGLIR